MSDINQEIKAIRTIQATLEKLTTTQGERVWNFVTDSLREKAQKERIVQFSRVNEQYQGIGCLPPGDYPATGFKNEN